MVLCWVVTALAAASCSGEAATVLVAPQAPESTTPEPATPGVSQADAFVDEGASEPAGMYGWDPEGGFHNAVWSGVLSVEGRCVYLDVTSQDAIGVAESAPLRSFVRLPEPLTRLNAATGELWVGDRGPMSSGDEVVLLGSEGWQQEWNATQWNVRDDKERFHFAWDWESERGCPAHVSFYAASMSPATSENSHPVFDSAQADPLAGLFDEFDPELMGPAYAEYGVLVVDPPCIYVELQASSPDAENPTEQHAERYAVGLPRARARFDQTSNSLWVAEHGPMITGDRVLVGAVAEPSPIGSQFYFDGCYAQGSYRADWMSPDES